MDTPKNNTRRYAPDSIFKWIMDLQFSRLGIQILTQVEVGHLPRTIDVVFVPPSETLRKRAQLKTALSPVRSHNLIEFKSENDRLTIFDLQLIEARAKLYMNQNRILSRDVTITIICARTPRKVLHDYPEDIEFESLGGGYYRNTGKLPIHIIAINELEGTPENYPLLMFASSKQKFVEFLRDAIGRNDSDDDPILTYAYFLRSNLTQELEMPLKNRLSKEALAYIIEDIGDEILSCFSVEELASRLSAEELASHLSAEELTSHLSAEERVAGLSVEERIAGLSPDERRQLQQLLEQ